jgi:hypothetical protein
MPVSSILQKFSKYRPLKFFLLILLTTQSYTVEGSSELWNVPCEFNLNIRPCRQGTQMTASGDLAHETR